MLCLHNPVPSDVFGRVSRMYTLENNHFLLAKGATTKDVGFSNASAVVDKIDNGCFWSLFKNKM